MTSLIKFLCTHFCTLEFKEKTQLLIFCCPLTFLWRRVFYVHPNLDTAPPNIVCAEHGS